MWHITVQTDAIEAGNDEIATCSIRTHHLFHMRPAVFQTFDRSVLCRCRCRHDDVLMDLVHRRRQGRVGQDITQTPAGHGKRFGEAADDDHLIFDLIELCEGSNRTIIGQFCIDLITDDDQLMLFDDRNQFGVIFIAHHPAGRIAWEIDQQDLCLFADGLFQILWKQFKIIFLTELDRYADTAGKRDAGCVGNIRRVHHDDLIARIDQRPQCDIDALAAADRYDDIIVWIVFDVKATLIIAADLLAQFEQSLIGRIMRLAAFDGVDGRITDVPWRGKIRFADTERDDTFDLAGKVEKTADPAWLDRLYPL